MSNWIKATLISLSLVSITILGMTYIPIIFMITICCCAIVFVIYAVKMTLDNNDREKTQGKGRHEIEAKIEEIKRRIRKEKHERGTSE